MTDNDDYEAINEGDVNQKTNEANDEGDANQKTNEPNDEGDANQKTNEANDEGDVNQKTNEITVNTYGLNENFVYNFYVMMHDLFDNITYTEIDNDLRKLAPVFPKK